MIVPHVDHWDLGIGHAEKTLGEPHRISLKVECFQFLTHGRRKVSSTFMVWILDMKPFVEKWALFRDSIVVYLVSSTNHDMERSCLMTIEHIAPKRVRSREVIGAETL